MFQYILKYIFGTADVIWHIYAAKVDRSFSTYNVKKLSWIPSDHLLKQPYKDSFCKHLLPLSLKSKQ